jgi:hypothetical protein
LGYFVWKIWSLFKLFIHNVNFVISDCWYILPERRMYPFIFQQKIYLFILLTMKYFVVEMKQYLWRRQLLILLVYTLWYSILGKPLLIEGCNRHYHWYDSESDRTGCDMVCQDLQNWQYCFIGYVIMCLMPHWSIIFSNRVSPMIHRIWDKRENV